MSHITHQTICITSQNLDSLNTLHSQIREIGASITPIFPSPNNQCATFYVLPSGSKAYWNEAEEHLLKIEAIKEVIKSFADEDNSNPFDYIIAEYGATNNK